MTPDELFMQRTFELALNGVGSVSPNPLVGCVIVYDNKIIGEGWHKQHGQAHAEVNAVESVQDKSLLTKSTVYVNLEPCTHTGKTPPCADMLIRHGVKKVIISNIDTNPLVSGKGIQKLKDAGIEVVTGILEKEGRALNKRFFTFVEKKRPYIILKWAQTKDGFIARNNFDSKWISNEHSRQLVHQWRSEEDAVLVGKMTALKDNPALTVRDWIGRNPLRIIIDRNLELPLSLHLFDHTEKTVCYNLLKDEEQKNISFIRLEENNFIQQLLIDLYKRQIQSVIIEGGSQTIKLFVELGLWDEGRIFTSTQTFKEGISAPQIKGETQLVQSVLGDELTWIRQGE